MITKEDIGKKIEIIGILKEKSKIYLKIKSLKFECPSCGTILDILQLEEKIKEPRRCSCGRRGGFKIIKKEVEEVQDALVFDGESGFEFKVYFEKRNLIKKLGEIALSSSVKITGILKDNFKKNLTKGDFIIEAEDIEFKSSDKLTFD